MKQAVHRLPSLQNLHPGLAPTFPCGSEVQLCGEASYQHTILKWRACSARGPPVVCAAGERADTLSG